MRECSVIEEDIQRDASRDKRNRTAKKKHNNITYTALGLLHPGGRGLDTVSIRGDLNVITKRSQHTIDRGQLRRGLALGEGLGSNARLLLLVECLCLDLSLGLQPRDQFPVSPPNFLCEAAEGAEATAGLQAQDLEGLGNDHALLGVVRSGDALVGLCLFCVVCREKE